MTTPEFEPLDAGEVEVVDDQDPSELLWRQICDHSWDVEYGRPGKDSFGPQGSDKRRPSYARMTQVTAQASRDWHNNNALSKSRGVWACSVAEVREANTRCVDDSCTPLPPGEKRAPGHAYVDYRPFSKKGMKTVKSMLLKAALARGEIYTVDNS